MAEAPKQPETDNVPEGGGGSDAGKAPEAGGGSDAGNALEAGGGSDAGNAPEAGGRSDAGNAPEAGEAAKPDAGQENKPGGPQAPPGAPPPPSDIPVPIENLYMPIAILTGVFGGLFIILPLLVRKGPNRGIIRCIIMLSLFSIWIFWVTIYISQMNPIMGPRMHNTTLLWLAYKIGNPVKPTYPPAEVDESDTT